MILIYNPLYAMLIPIIEKVVVIDVSNNYNELLL